MKILILTIATNKYIQFVERLYDNIEEKFLNGHEIQGLLFTEHDVETSDNIKVSQIDHEPWPMPTLKRFNYFVKEKDYISQFDYCYYFDIDMGIVQEVGDEVYENNAYVEDIDKFLSDYNMTRVETDWAGDIWGDALYIRQK